MHDLSSSDTKHSTNKAGIVILFVVILFLLLGSMLGLYGFNKTHKQPPVTATPSHIVSSAMPFTPTPMASLSATPSIASLSAVQVRILNGSGIAGSTQGIASALRSTGFTQLIIGNAPAFTYRGIAIQVTQEGSRYLPQIRAAVSKAEPTAGTTTTVIQTIPSDIQIIVGSY